MGSTAKPVVAIIGGTGELGSGLARRWSAAGYTVVLGSRSAEKARAAAADMAGGVTGADMVGAAETGSVVVLAVPFASHDEVLAELRPVLVGKILVDACVPLVPPKVSVVRLPAEGSAAQIAARILGEDVQVVSAFHNVGAAKLHGNGEVGCDTLVFGDGREAKELVMALADAAGSCGIDGGPLANSAAAEAMTSVLIGINRRYKVGGAGIRVTGLPGRH